MIKWFTVLCLINLSANGQVIADTAYYGSAPNWIKVVTYRNATTTSFLPKEDTASKIATKWKLDSTAAALATQLINALALKQNAGNYASGVSNTGDNAVNNLYSGLASSKENAFTILSGKTLATFNYAADLGANDSYVISLSPAPASYTTGMVIYFKANTVNTGAASINVNGLGVKTIIKRVSTVLANGDIPALSFKMLIYDGTSFVLLNPVVN